MRTGMMAVITLVLGARITLAQSFGSISGRLLEEGGEPLPFTSVSADQGGNVYTAETDLDGRFSVKPLPPGVYVLRIVALNVDRTMDGIIVSGDNITVLDNIRLKSAMELPEARVEKWRFEPKLLDKDNPGVTKIFHTQFKNSPLAKDPKGLIVAYSPGVTKAPNGDGLFFRGARSENMCYFVDGVKLGDRLSGVSGNAINSFSVYTGGLPAKYGDVTGGVVAIETKSYFDLWQQRNAGIQ